MVSHSFPSANFSHLVFNSIFTITVREADSILPILQFSHLTDETIRDQVMGPGEGRVLQISPVPSGGCLATNFMTNIVKLLVFMATEELKKGKQEYSKLKCQTRCSFCNLAFFFFNKCSLVCCKTLVNFQSYEKVCFDHFASVLAFSHKRLFRAPYSAIPTYITTC